MTLHRRERGGCHLLTVIDERFCDLFVHRCNCGTIIQIPVMKTADPRNKSLSWSLSRSNAFDEDEIECDQDTGTATVESLFNADEHL